MGQSDRCRRDMGAEGEGCGIGPGIDYTLIRSRRKTVSVSVERDLTVVVRAPQRMASAAIDRFVAEHAEWIAKHRSRMAEPARIRAAFTYADGQVIPFRGRELVLASGTGGIAQVQDGRLLVAPGEHRPAAVAALLKEEARQQVEDGIQRYRPVMGVVPSGVKITSATTRWGSCSGKGGLCFSYRIACLPEMLVDYIIVHELAHIREHNHSERFWAIVRDVLPDYLERRRQLRVFGESIPF